MAAVVHHDAVAAESVRNGDRNSGSGVGQSSSTPGQTHRRIRKAIIESDPEEDEEMPVTGSLQSSTSNHANSTVKEGSNPTVHPSVRNGSRISSRINNSSETLSVNSGNLSGSDANLPSTSGGQSAAMYTMDTDISQLEAPTFTTLDRGPSQTMIDLTWDHKVNLIGKKVISPMVHICDKCKRPILIYGRMNPCKHVFCLSCATQYSAPAATSICPRCSDKVVRIEEAGLGSIYMCSQEGSRYGSNGCKKTYLSPRTLQAHIQHRHLEKHQAELAMSTCVGTGPSPVAQPNSNSISTPRALVISTERTAIVTNRRRQENQQHRQPAAVATAAGMTPRHSRIPTSEYQNKFSLPPPHRGSDAISYNYATAGQVKYQQSNLITVPIQDNAAYTASRGKTTGANYGVTPQSEQWAQKEANAAPVYASPTDIFYRTSTNNSGSKTTSNVIGGYNTTHVITTEGHSRHSSERHHQNGVTFPKLMDSNSQWTQQPNNRTAGFDQTASAIEHLRKR